MASEKKVFVKRELYKTELCRHYVLREQCPYKDKCQFAHGSDEINDVIRHPKYKTELCKGYHSTGFCPYGPRCHFIHGADPEQDNNRTSSSAPVRTMGSAKKRRWLSSSKSGGHGREVWERANDWQNEDQEMLTEWMNQDLPDSWVTPLHEAASGCLEGQDLEQPAGHIQKIEMDRSNAVRKQPADWANHALEASIDHLQQLPNWDDEQFESYCSRPRNENWINQFGDADQCRYLLMKQSNFVSSRTQSQENCDYILPSQSFSVQAVSADWEASNRPKRPSCFANQLFESSPVMRGKNWNQSYLLQNSIPNSPSDVDSLDWSHQMSALPSVPPLGLSPVWDMFNLKMAFSSQELISNVSSVLEIFSHNLAANSQSCISNKQACPAFDIPNRNAISS